MCDLFNGVKATGVRPLSGEFQIPRTLSIPQDAQFCNQTITLNKIGTGTTSISIIIDLLLQLTEILRIDT
jgi:hypothetical protein